MLRFVDEAYPALIGIARAPDALVGNNLELSVGVHGIAYRQLFINPFKCSKSPAQTLDIDPYSICLQMFQSLLPCLED